MHGFESFRGPGPRRRRCRRLALLSGLALATTLPETSAGAAWWAAGAGWGELVGASWVCFLAAVAAWLWATRE